MKQEEDDTPPERGFSMSGLLFLPSIMIFLSHVVCNSWSNMQRRLCTPVCKRRLYTPDFQASSARSATEPQSSWTTIPDDQERKKDDYSSSVCSSSAVSSSPLSSAFMPSSSTGFTSIRSFISSNFFSPIPSTSRISSTFSYGRPSIIA